jgi:very-short-patch-repair endonuclease
MSQFSGLSGYGKNSKYKILSPLEGKIVDELLKYENVKFETNYKVHKYFVDIAFPEFKVGLEIDGHKYHTSDEQKARDELRQEYLEEVCGWKIERVAGWFCHRHPEITVAKVLRRIKAYEDHPRYQLACEMAKAWYVNDLNNRGLFERAKRIKNA